jgi:hypothetical protein
MACLRGLYLIEGQCLLDDFLLVSKRPWEPNLTSVLCITLRKRADQTNKPSLGRHVMHVRDGPTKVLRIILATSIIII